MADIEDEAGTGIEDESGAPIADEAGHLSAQSGDITPAGASARSSELARSATGDL